MSVHSTPYDRHMTRIQPVSLPKSAGAGEVSLALVNHWMEDLCRSPYGFTQVWKTPAETAAGAPADRKAKPVVVYERNEIVRCKQ